MKITLKSDGRFEHFWPLGNAPKHAIDVPKSVAMGLSQNPQTKKYDSVTGMVVDYIPPFDLVAAQNAKRGEINAAAEAQITGGFISNALGTDHLYQSDRDDQLNLAGLASNGGDWPFKCSADNGVTWSYVLHTSAQLKQVESDGLNHKLAALQHAADLKAQIDAATTQAEIDAIVW